MAAFQNTFRRSAFGLIRIARSLPSAPTKSTRPPTAGHSFLNLERTKWRSFTTTKNGPQKEEPMTMWQRFLAPKPMPERHTFAWYREMLLICTVFAVTGSSTMVVVRPAVSKGLGIKGSLKDGPWTYRICSLVIMTPLYAALLVCVGTLFGRHAYFRHFAVKIYSRFIDPTLLDPTFHETKKSFRKW